MKRKYFLFALLITSVAIAGCIKKQANNNEAGSQQNNKGEEVMMEVEGADTYKAVVSSSRVQWKGERKLLESEHTGTVQIQDGEIMLKDGVLVGGKVVIDMSTIIDESQPRAMAEKLEGHLKSGDFFDVESHPTSMMEVTGVSVNEDGSYNVTADLTIKGITKSLVIPVTIDTDGNALEASVSFSIDRTEFDIKFQSGKFFTDLGDKVLDDMIEFNISVVAKK